ncbi:MAG TPA: hypothetical protein VFR55_00295 [Dehalococcoidia bacterium]|nr:hypothetical protein [Dehalococcoidia bacterium]
MRSISSSGPSHRTNALGAETCAARYTQHIEAVAGLFSDLSDADQRELLRLLNLLGADLERRGIVDEYPGSEI